MGYSTEKASSPQNPHPKEKKLDCVELSCAGAAESSMKSGNLERLGVVALRRQSVNVSDFDVLEWTYAV